MLVVSAERGGLYANVTRMVHFEEHNETVLDVGFLSLGPLKGNRGNQTYELPAEFDPNKHRSISIWCQRFSVNFATAPLR